MLVKTSMCVCLFVLVKLLLCLPCLFLLIIYAKSVCVWFFLYNFVCLLILKMCKLGAKTCYDYYLWVYLFKGGYLVCFFFQFIFLYPTLWSVSLYMSMCALIDSVLFSHVSVLLISSRLDACINFCLVFANCCLPCSFGFLLCLRCWSCVDLLYGE